MCNQADNTPDVDVAQLRDRFTQLRKQQAAAGRTLVLLAIILIALFGVFTFTTVNRVRDNFNEHAVNKAVSDHLPAVAPLAGAQLQKAALGAFPTYQQLAIERFGVVRPQLAAKAMDRLDDVPDRAGHLMNDRLAGSFDRALKRIEPELTAAFPSLTNDQKRQILADHFHATIAVRNKELASHIEAIYTNELIGVHSALEKFDLPAANAAIPADRLQRDFFHSLLVLADYELLNHDTANQAQAATKKPATPASAKTAEASTAE